jgi:hypothetical protein
MCNNQKQYLANGPAGWEKENLGEDKEYCSKNVQEKCSILSEDAEYNVDHHSKIEEGGTVFFISIKDSKSVR